MVAWRRARLLALLVGDGGPSTGPEDLCRMAVAASDVTGAGIMLLSDDGPRGSLGGTDDLSAIVERLHFTLGEGPCIDAFEQDRAVVEPDLADPEVPRWPAFSGLAVESGVRAVFGFPVRVGVARLGVLALHRDRPGSLDADQHADSLVAAEISAEAILALQAEAEPGQLAQALDRNSDFRAVVHQASGMVAAQLGIGVEQAMIRLRAYAFVNERNVSDVARDVVDRILWFD